MPLTLGSRLGPDGKRIVALMPAAGGDAQQVKNHVVFLQNFFDELRRRAPVGKCALRQVARQTGERPRLTLQANTDKILT